MYSLRSSDWLTLPLVHLTDWFIELESKLCRLEILLDCKIKKLTTFWETRSLASSARNRESCHFRITDCKHVMFFVTSILAYSYLVYSIYVPLFMINIISISLVSSMCICHIPQVLERPRQLVRLLLGELFRLWRQPVIRPMVVGWSQGTFSSLSSWIMSFVVLFSHWVVFSCNLPTVFCVSFPGSFCVLIVL